MLRNKNQEITVIVFVMFVDEENNLLKLSLFKGKNVWLFVPNFNN